MRSYFQGLKLRVHFWRRASFYFGVDREAGWLVVKERIPALKPLSEQILRELEAQ